MLSKTDRFTSSSLKTWQTIAASGGTGLFINEGEFITQHDGTAWSHFTIAPTFQQNSGAFRVQGPSATLGTVINNNSTFSGGEILVGDEAKRIASRWTKEP